MSIATVGWQAGTSDRGVGAAGLSLVLGTSVLTMDGLLPVDYLMPGDRLVTRGGAVRVVAVAAELRVQSAVVRVGRDVFGLGKPGEDVLLLPDQAILIRDWRAKALFGQPQAFVAAARLVDGEYVRADLVAELRVISLRLERASTLYAGGLELACPALAAPGAEPAAAACPPGHNGFQGLL